MFDVMLSTIGLLLALPVMLLIFLLSKADTGSPIFLQKRVGRNKNLFTLIKFRTMAPNTPSVASHMVNNNAITPLGHFLRRFKLDELPQLWNVARGDMSLVGPRPERPAFVERFEQVMPGYNRRHDIPPGITGLAQIRGRYQTDPAFKLGHDLQYIVNWSLVLDLLILAETVAVVIRRSER